MRQLQETGRKTFSFPENIVRDAEEFIQKGVKDKRWKPFRCNYACVWIHETGKFILKGWTCICSDPPDFAIPTLRLGEDYRLQPRAERGKGKAAKALNELLDKAPVCSWDSHIGNTGYFQGRPVAIDW